MNGIKCEYCGKFIAFADFDADRIAWTPIAAAYTHPMDPPEPTEPGPICVSCQEKEKRPGL